jgi:NTP pyrophosphatase (non-canonical NTP hydrolase)
MNINKLIPICYDIAKQREQYRVCPECGGRGYIGENQSNEKVLGYSGNTCSNCNGSGIDPNIPISELLMRVIEEIGEANRAFRDGKKVDLSWMTLNTDSEALQCENIRSVEIKQKAFSISYTYKVKGSFPDELADILITLLSICGYLGIEDFDNHSFVVKGDNITHAFTMCCSDLLNAIKEHNAGKIDRRNEYLSGAYTDILSICTYNNIPIEKYVLAKIEYNKIRRD